MKRKQRKDQYNGKNKEWTRRKVWKQSEDKRNTHTHTTKLVAFKPRQREAHTLAVSAINDSHAAMSYLSAVILQAEESKGREMVHK